MCDHSVQREVFDTPIADEVTGEFLGRFNITACDICSEILVVGNPYVEGDEVGRR